VGKPKRHQSGKKAIKGSSEQGDLDISGIKKRRGAESTKQPRGESVKETGDKRKKSNKEKGANTKKKPPQWGIQRGGRCGKKRGLQDISA